MRIAMAGLLLTVPMLGCADAQQSPKLTARIAMSDEDAIQGMRTAAAFAKQGGGQRKAEAPAVAKAEAPPAVEEVQRKIIFTAHLDLVVQDIDKAQTSLEKALEEVKAYIARSEMKGAPGSPRDGSWTLRVPVAQFGTLRQALTKLGVLRRNSVDSEDITDQFYDTQARLKNNQVEEEGLRKLYLEKAPSSKMEELLAIRRELATVRGTIEQQQGQINRWDKQTRLATIELHLTEVRDYVPPSHPGFGASISTTFWGSINALVGLGKGLFLVLIALLPWLPLLGLLAVAIWVLVRRKSARPTASA